MAKMDKLSEWMHLLGASVKSVAKVALLSRKCTVAHDAHDGEPLIIMGNGPSLNDTIRDDFDLLSAHKTLAVNYAAKSPDFFRLKPRYYVMIDPVFFTEPDNVNVQQLWRDLSERVDWDMTLFIPAGVSVLAKFPADSKVRVQRINPVGVEGFKWLENCMFASGRGMPRPRNVLIASLMVALKLGFKRIFIVGADHTWSKSLEVDENNVVVSVQPHFYKDNEAEHKRNAAVYKNIRLHQIYYSFYVAFSSYFAIERFARHIGADIYNATPGSFIDAFRRKPLSDIERP